jgi:hypothetical protein
MILFGIAEMVTAFNHNFLGIATAKNLSAQYAGATIGILYVLAGLLVSLMKRWAAVLALICLAIDVVGRIWMAVRGSYPMNSEKQIAIVMGTAVVIVFGVYIASKWQLFK